MFENSGYWDFGASAREFIEFQSGNPDVNTLLKWGRGVIIKCYEL